MQSIDEFDAQQFADHLTKVSNDDGDMYITSQALQDKYDVDFDGFQNVLTAIFPHIDIGQSPLTKEAYIGCSIKDEKGGGMWMFKRKFTSELISSVIEFCTDGENLKPGEGFEKTITNGGQLEYTIIIRKAGALKKTDFIRKEVIALFNELINRSSLVADLGDEPNVMNAESWLETAEESLKRNTKHKR